MDDRVENTKIVATKLLKEHGLIKKGWHFGLDRAKTRCGVCDYGAKVISLSRLYVQEPSVSFEDIENTILHEIAHALAGYEAAHGPLWKQMAKSIGCNGNTCNTVWRGADKKYRIHCDCGRVNIRRHRVAPKFKQSVCKFCDTLHIEAREAGF